MRAAINRVFGSGNPVPRCRHHKIKNVCDQLPDELAAQVKSVMKAAYELAWQEGRARLKKQAHWLETHYPGAAASLLKVWKRPLPLTAWNCLPLCGAVWAPPISLKAPMPGCA